LTTTENATELVDARPLRTSGAVAGTKARPDRVNGAFARPWIDALFMGGFSVLAYAFFALRPNFATTAAVGGFAASASWVINWPHFSATNMRLYGSRRNLKQYPVTAIAAPIIAIAFAVAAFLSRDVAAPALAKLYLLWSPYHFSGQTIGLTLLYAKRYQRSFSALERRILMAFVFGLFIVPSLRAEVGRRTYTFYGISYRSFDIATWIPRVAYVLFVAAAVALVAVLARARIREGKRLPLLICVPAFAQWIWFMATPAGSYRYLVPMFHSLQYLYIAWTVQVIERSQTRSEREKISRGALFLTDTTIRWAGINFVGGVILFWALPILFSGIGQTLAFSTGVVLSVVQIHHFFVDGVIWKLAGTSQPSPLAAHLSSVISSDVKP
jgi:hypothetical protein